MENKFSTTNLTKSTLNKLSKKGYYVISEAFGSGNLQSNGLINPIAYQVIINGETSSILTHTEIMALVK